jgi:hypothetical protein
LFAPVAKDDKEPLTGLVRYELFPDKETGRLPVNKSNHGAYLPTGRGISGATLTWRLTPLDKRVSIPNKQFRLHVEEVENAEHGQLPKVELDLGGGFRPGYLYELIYEAQDPLVHGVCFASVRDLIAAFKHGEGAANPLLLSGQPVIKRAHGFGVSQSGRFLREYLYSGFNADSRDRIVFDGLIPHVAGGGLGSFNHRFAQPTAYATQHEFWDFGTDRFPFSYEMQTDSVSKQQDGILRRASESSTAPKIMHTQSSTEYWTRSGSLVHTDTLGRKDAELPDNVRIYAFGGTQHGPASFPPSQGKGLLSSLDRWCRDNTPPPPSVYPLLRDGTLRYFSQSSTRFPAIPSVRYPEVMNEPNLLNFGKRWRTEGIIDLQPPRLLGRYAALVPGSGKDGNDLGCLLPPEVGVPMATFTGWSLRRAAAGPENELVGLNGSYIPLPVTKAERDESGDPRLSLEERYGSQEKYLADLKRYCQQLVAGGYLLAEDMPRIMKRQKQRAANRFAALATP